MGLFDMPDPKKRGKGQAPGIFAMQTPRAQEKQPTQRTMKQDSERRLGGEGTLVGAVEPAVEKGLAVAGKALRKGREKFRAAKAKRVAKKKKKVVSVGKGFKKVEIKRLTPVNEDFAEGNTLGLKSLKPL